MGCSNFIGAFIYPQYIEILNSIGLSTPVQLNEFKKQAKTLLSANERGLQRLPRNATQNDHRWLMVDQLDRLSRESNVELTVKTILRQWNTDRMFSFYLVHCSHTTAWEDMESEIKATYAQSGGSAGVAASTTPKSMSKSSLTNSAKQFVKRSLSRTSR